MYSFSGTISIIIFNSVAFDWRCKCVNNVLALIHIARLKFEDLKKILKIHIIASYSRAFTPNVDRYTFKWTYKCILRMITCALDIVLTITVNILTIKELVKLTMLWTTGPKSLKPRQNRQMKTTYNRRTALEWSIIKIVCVCVSVAVVAVGVVFEARG